MNSFIDTNTDIQLLQALSRGERKAAESIYRQHYPVMLGWIRKKGGEADDAADIFQEALTVLFEKSQSPAFVLSCRIGTYLFAVGRNLWLKKLQRSKLSPGFLPDEDMLAYEDDLPAHEEKELHFQQLDAALESLGEPCRTLLKAFYHHDKSMSEIAAEFGYTNPDNAKTQKYKCLTRLKKIFYGG